jgi:hypothetical protein
MPNDNRHAWKHVPPRADGEVWQLYVHLIDTREVDKRGPIADAVKSLEAAMRRDLDAIKDFSRADVADRARQLASRHGLYLKFTQTLRRLDELIAAEEARAKNRARKAAAADDAAKRSRAEFCPHGARRPFCSVKTCRFHVSRGGGGSDPSNWRDDNRRR